MSSAGHGKACAYTQKFGGRSTGPENRAANQRGDPSSQRHLSGLGGLQIPGAMIYGAAVLSGFQHERRLKQWKGGIWPNS